MQEYEIGALLDDLERDGIDCLPHERLGHAAVLPRSADAQHGGF